MIMRIGAVVALAFVLGCPDGDSSVVDPPQVNDAIAAADGGSGTDSAGGKDVVAIPDNSCKSSCGGNAPAGCGCDNACTERGDCCADKLDVCGPYKPPKPEPSASCLGVCGHAAPSGCSCEDGCEDAGTCCVDKKDWCGATEPVGPEPNNSCSGFCGNQAPGGCWCNNDCHEADNCCPDKVEFCGEYKPPVQPPSESCEGVCGQQAESGCWCNNECHEAGNCCEDKTVFCGDYKPPVQPPSESCEGVCGQQAESGCWCNNECHETGDCCEDKVLFCGEYKPPLPPAQCKGMCGGQAAAGCWCNNACHENDNCCEDKVQFCGPYEPPVEPVGNSCLNICGQQAPDGCWCNNACHENDNCCPDKEENCGPYKPPVEPPNASCVGICGQDAESGCGCGDGCHAAGNCCADKEAICGAAPDSCTGRCGEEAPAGCSCVDGCESDATCCGDKAEVCGTPPVEVEGSCEGVCGEQTPQGCWCDDLCEVSGDCCGDKAAQCGAGTAPQAGSCLDNCGGQAPEGCWCDETCEAAGDCCDDKVDLCGATEPVGVASCEGLCGQQAPSGCWCDEACEANDDCCQNKADFCGATTCESVGYLQGSCAGGLNKTQCADGSAFECMALDGLGLNCWVLTAPCSTTEVCVDPLGPIGAHCEADPQNPANSCDGLCGQQAPGGCWCDPQCEQSGDCCPDKGVQCGATSCEDLGHALGSCLGILNGTKCDAKTPFACQKVGGLKCWVQSDTCELTELCVDPIGPVGAHCEADPNDAANSCAGICDGQAAGGCWCDKKCEENGDCCPDVVAECGAATCEELGYALGGCGLFSGTKCEVGQPYACQPKGALNCWVQTDVCGDGDLCVDPFGPTGAHCEADPNDGQNSCAGICGDQAPGGCWCDDNCEQNGDCCPDKTLTCGAATCESLGFPGGVCGPFNGTKCQDNAAYDCQNVGPMSCWVLTEACGEGMKCSDPLLSGAHCVVDDGSPLNSCAGLCGLQAPGGCWCDAQCEDTGDCCADKKSQCGGTTCGDLGFENGACGLFNGSKCQDGQPWECQDQGPVRCWVQVADCLSSEICVDPIGPTGAHCQPDDGSPLNSCAGNCGGQALGGCSCEDSCVQTGDCCADKVAECGASTCEALGYGQGKCGFFDATECQAGQPYECLKVGSLDCWAPIEVCLPGQTCEDPLGPTGAHCVGDPTGNPDSCLGFCGDQAPGGCWCDPQCADNGDCCLDYDVQCPPQ